jgi:hypothetical protein
MTDQPETHIGRSFPGLTPDIETALRNRIAAAIADALKPRYGGPQHNTPGGLPLTATAEEIRLHRAQPLADAVLAVLPAFDELLRRAARRAPGEAVGFQEVPLKDGGTYVRLDRLSDGRVMCQLCFSYCTRDELNPVEGGVEDVCQSCAILEAARRRIRELEGQAREADRLRKDWEEQRRLTEAAQARVRELEARLRITEPWVCPVCGKKNNQDPCVICETDRPETEEAAG